MKILDDVTLVLVDTVNYGNAVNSLQKSLEQIRPAKTLFFTDIDVKLPVDAEIVKIPTIHSKREYSDFIIKKLGLYIETDFVLVTQWDSWVLNGDAWNDEFYDYDFVGAPWLYSDERNVGNGGFSLRSRRLQKILAEDNFIEVCDPEDEVIGRLYRNHLEDKYDIKFPTEELADTFSFELRTPICKTFGFHSFFHEPYQETVIIKRTGAMGDVIALEPLLHHFFKKRFRVVLDTLPQFQNLFIQHYFKVHRLDELDQRLLPEAKTYNMDMSYETNPKQLHLKTYFEYCGISDYKLRNPRLEMNFDPKINKLFSRYAVIHIDERPQASRNIKGVDWKSVTGKLNELGYIVIQIGVGKHEEMLGAIFMNTPSEPMLMWVIGGADLFVGIDSGPSHIAIAMGIPVIICYGSVNPKYLIPDLTNVTAIHNKDACEKEYCWHSVVGCEGAKCYIDNDDPPCNKFSTEEILVSIDKILNNEKNISRT